MSPKPRKCHAAEKKHVSVDLLCTKSLEEAMNSKIPWRFITGSGRKYGLDYDIYAGMRTLGYITVLTKADLVLMTTTEDGRVKSGFVGIFHKLNFFMHHG